MTTNGNEPQTEVNLPVAVLGEQTLAVDLARAEIDQAIATAHRFPRSLDVVLKKIGTMACYNEAAAENCIYSLPRGGKPIIGASIGFANIVAQAWGNCKDAARIVYIDRKEKVVVAEGGFHDLETNRQTIVPVQRRIVDRQGRLFNDDMIMVTGMAAASIARRNAILNAVPRALWFPIYEQALAIVRGTVETFAERKAKALAAFAQFGVKPEQVYMVLGLKGEADLTLEHIAPMRGMYSALRDGSVTVEEMFDPRRQTGAGFEKVSNPLADEEVGGALASAGGTGEGSKPATASPAQDKPKRGRPKRQEPAPSGEMENPVPVQEQPAPIETDFKPDDAAPSPEAFEKNPVPAPASKPRNAAEYKAYMIEWLAKMPTAEHVIDRWRADRDLRGDCSVIGDEIGEMKALIDKRLIELKPPVPENQN